jgi:hypothetical protein
MIYLIGGLVLVVVTAVHELGHGIAVRVKGGRVLRVQVGRGPRLWSVILAGTEIVFALLPFGGRIHYDGVRPGSGELVVAVGGAIANLTFSLVVFAVAFSLLGSESTPFSEGMEGAIEYAARSAGLWFWMIPGAVGDFLLSGVTPELNRSIRAVLAHVSRAEPGGILYLSAAMSAVWAALNLIPVPGLRTDGWAALVGLWRMVLRR